jgi:hypothetical protein
MWANVTSKVAQACGSVDAVYSPALFSDSCASFINGALPLYITFTVYIGLPHAEHSGNDRCLMHYFFATAYPSSGDPTTYFVSKAATERPGSILCTSLTGTGVNDPNRGIPAIHPQPRYFDAAPNRGSCEKWICVNDKYPPFPN